MVTHEIPAIKFSIILACLSWLTVFGLLWKAVLRDIPLDGLTIGAWVFSLLIAIFASSVASSKR